MNKKIYLANLSFQTSESEIRTLFSKAGEVTSVKIARDRQTGQPKGIAFVEMSTQWEARRAISMINQTELNGNKLLAKEATVKRGFGDR